MKPILLDKKENIEDFKRVNPINQAIDEYKNLLEELFLIRNPRYRFDKNYSAEFEKFIKDHIGAGTIESAGNWFYFPWNKFLVHFLPDDMHQEIRTARNKNIITADEQQKFYNFKVGVAGMSVGSHPALTLVMMGAARVMKVADPDEISGSNLNRLRYGFTLLGINKCEVVARQIYEMNPYAELYEYPKGITMENIPEFLAGPPKLDVLVEEVDNLEMKIRLRLEAKKLGIPVVMATDNGDNAIVDIERYDIDRNLRLFNGAAGNLSIEEFQKFQLQDMPKLATKIAGPNIVVPRMLRSLLEVGRTLYSWPQLGDAATLSGVAVAYVVKRLALGEPIKTGKLEINLDSIFDPEYDSSEAVKKRENEREQFKKTIGL